MPALQWNRDKMKQNMDKVFYYVIIVLLAFLIYYLYNLQYFLVYLLMIAIMFLCIIAENMVELLIQLRSLNTHIRDKY